MWYMTRRSMVIGMLAWVAGLAGCAGTMRDGPAAVNYVPDGSYHLLMAEIAVQRDQHLVAAEEYLSSAQQSRDPELARRATEYAFEQGFDRFAMKAALQWQRLSPDDRLLHEYLARLYLRRNNIASALAHTERWLGPAGERSRGDYIGLGTDLADEENTTGVTRLLGRLRARHPEAAGLGLALAGAALRSGDHELARLMADRAGSSGPERARAAILAARARFAAGDADLALESLADSMSAGFPIGLQAEYIRLAASAGRPLMARRVLAQLVAAYGERADFLRMDGWISLAAGDLDRAAAVFGRLLEAGDNREECFYHLGGIAAARGEHREAIRTLSRIHSGPFLLPAIISISASWQALGDPEAGLELLDRFVSANPARRYDVLETRALLLRSMGRSEDAVREYTLALQHKPHNINYLIARATLLESLGRLPSALDDMSRAVEIAPHSAHARNTFGYTLTNRTSRHREARRHIRLAVGLDRITTLPVRASPATEEAEDGKAEVRDLKTVLSRLPANWTKTFPQQDERTAAVRAEQEGLPPLSAGSVNAASSTTVCPSFTLVWPTTSRPCGATLSTSSAIEPVVVAPSSSVTAASIV